MTAKEYNKEFLPKIQHAQEFISLFESAIQHMDERIVDKDEVMKQFKIRCWSEETKETILTALRHYKKYEGLDKVERLSEVRNMEEKKINTITVRWWDGYKEDFRATEVRFGSDLLWMRLEDGNNRHIPLRMVRWFGTSIESHQNTGM